MFVGYLIENNCKSGTVRSYVSVVKAVLKDDGEEINENTFLLNSLTRACRISNDHVRTRLPIRKGLLKQLVIEIDNRYNEREMQPYLAKLFKALFVTTYYGLFRVGELTQSEHVVKAADVHIGRNKKKLMFVLHSSKTHGKDGKPQIIKINSSDIQITDMEKERKNLETNSICPFEILKQYVMVRRTRRSDKEQFFVFHDRSPVMPHQFRSLLKELIKNIGLDSSLYGTMSMRAGRSVDLMAAGLSVESIKSLGRWKSSAVYRYLTMQ